MDYENGAARSVLGKRSKPIEVEVISLMMDDKG